MDVRKTEFMIELGSSIDGWSEFLLKIKEEHGSYGMRYIDKVAKSYGAEVAWAARVYTVPIYFPNLESKVEFMLRWL